MPIKVKSFNKIVVIKIAYNLLCSNKYALINPLVKNVFKKPKISSYHRYYIDVISAWFLDYMDLCSPHFPRVLIYVICFT